MIGKNNKNKIKNLFNMVSCLYNGDDQNLYKYEYISLFWPRPEKKQESKTTTELNLVLWHYYGISLFLNWSVFDISMFFSAMKFYVQCIMSVYWIYSMTFKKKDTKKNFIHTFWSYDHHSVKCQNELIYVNKQRKSRGKTKKPDQ